METERTSEQTFEIKSKILKATSKCTQNFGCLGNENHVCLGKVGNSIGSKVHFVNCIERRCLYQMSYGYSIICNCPTRKEIHNKYRK